MAPTKMKLRMRKKDGSSKASRSMSAEASPDSKCPICLDRFNNVASLDRCLHKFCFRCIHEWSKNKAECPLCKQPFNSIFHTIKAENDFKEFVLRPAENGAPESPGSLRLRYSGAPTRERRQSPRQSSPPPDNGVIFEGLTGPAPQQQDRGIQCIMMRLATRRRAQSKGRTVRHLREQEMVTFRRALYRTGVRVRGVPDGGGGQQREVSAAFFQRNPACLQRLVPWLKRELTVLYGTLGSLVNIVQHIVMSRITRYDMDDRAIHDELRPFLLTRTEHFLHELISFARSPFDMEAYDRHAVYDCPAPSYEEGSSSASSVIAISEDERDAGEPAPRPGSASGGGLSQAPWDDETPGPSYSTAEPAPSPSPSLSLSVSESESESSRGEAASPQVGPQAPQSPPVKADPAAKEDGGGAASSAEEECVIVGYVKPMAERTPELVQLSSDSEESGPELGPVEPLQLLRLPSLSPPSSMGSPTAPDQALPPPADQRKHGSGDSAPSTDVAFPPAPAGGVQCHHPGEERACEAGGGTRSRSGSGSVEWGGAGTSPTISVRSDSTPSRGRLGSRSRSRSRDRMRARRWDRDGGRARRARGKAAYSYHWESYSHYSREGWAGGVLYTQSRAYCSRLYASPAHPCRSRSPRRRGRRRSRSPSSNSSQSSRAPPRRARGDKPGGKRKYKTRHLEESAKGRAPKAGSALRGGGERHRKRARKKSRSPSVEIVYEGRATGDARRCPRRRKKHRRRSRRRRSRERRSPTVITIDSDSDRDVNIIDYTADINDRHVNITDCTGDISDRDVNITDCAADISERHVNITDCTGDISERDVNITDCTADVSDRNVNITDCTADVSDRGVSLSNRGVGVSSRAVQIGSSEANIADRDLNVSVNVRDPVADVAGGPYDGRRVGSVEEECAGVGHPSDARLLESILQELQQQQHILPLDQDAAAVLSHTEAASAELPFDPDKCSMLHAENRLSFVSSSDEASIGSPVMPIGSHFIEQSSLDEATDTNAICCSD